MALIRLTLKSTDTGSKGKRYKYQTNNKIALNLQQQTIQILTNDVQMIIVCLSYFITTLYLHDGQKKVTRFIIIRFIQLFLIIPFLFTNSQLTNNIFSL